MNQKDADAARYNEWIAQHPYWCTRKAQIDALLDADIKLKAIAKTHRPKDDVTVSEANRNVSVFEYNFQ